jgi:hypothetical protein
MRRLGVALTVATVLLGVGAGLAQACLNINIGPTGLAVGPRGPEAHPGGPVGFTISHTITGARWTVSVDGRSVASGVAEGDSVSGAFTLPDLGGATRVIDLGVTVEHEDIEGTSVSSTTPILYVVPSAAERPPAGTTSGPSPPASRPSPARAAAPPRSRAEPPPARHARTRASPAPTRATQVEQPATPRAAAKPTTQPKPVSRRAVTPRAAARKPAPQAARPQRPATPSLAPIARAVRQPARPDPSRTMPVQWLLAGALLALLLGAAGAGRRLVRRREGPRPEPDRRSVELEAELQEIIAEERARRHAERTRPE